MQYHSGTSGTAKDTRTKYQRKISRSGSLGTVLSGLSPLQTSILRVQEHCWTCSNNQTQSIQTQTKDNREDVQIEYSQDSEGPSSYSESTSIKLSSYSLETGSVWSTLQQRPSTRNRGTPYLWSTTILKKEEQRGTPLHGSSLHDALLARDAR